MSVYVEPTFVILGFDVRDAEGHYRVIVEEQPGRIFGHRVRLLGCQYPSSILGLRVHDFEATPRAMRHRAFPDALEILQRCVAKTQPTQNGDK